MVVNGWTLLFHEAIIGQMKSLADAYARARKASPKSFKSNANVELFAALGKLMLEVIPADPNKSEFRQGNTLGKQYRHWLRVKFFGRFRLFFRFDSQARIIVYAWVNDEHTLGQRGAKSDPYEVFRRMLATGSPPNDGKHWWAGPAGYPRTRFPSSRVQEGRRIRREEPDTRAFRHSAVQRVILIRSRARGVAQSDVIERIASQKSNTISWSLD